MRPEILFPLFSPLSCLPGLGKRLAPLYARLAEGELVVHALWLLPVALIDRRTEPSVAAASHGGVVTLTLNVESLPPRPPGGKAPWRIRCRDATGFLSLVYFHARPDWIKATFVPGQTVVASGKIEIFNAERQMPHPDYVVPPAQRDRIPDVETVYPLTAGIVGKTAGKAAQAALARAPDLPEWLDPALTARRNWPSWRRALSLAHAPREEADLSPLSPARSRLAYDELLANQLALLLVRRETRRLTGRALQGDGRLRDKTLAALPYVLTAAQRRAAAEISADMARPERMLRLLQGDVGSGKTVVAWLAMLQAVETGAQAALMAPTEILARQHAENLAPLARTGNVNIALLTGRDKGKSRRDLLAALAAGKIDVLIGTHALFQDDVVFKDLALIVIDEQHRFGVQQRLTLAQKSRNADMLVMTATPIPRTLSMTLYGDMDVSCLDEKPAGRKPIDTRIVPSRRMSEVVAAVARAVAGNARVFWICPLIEESEKSDLAAANERFQALKSVFADRVGLVHGRMKAAEKDAAMDAFAAGTLSILIATTVVEVGVDVPAASIMVIEHAERFGLAQLHQLRGRIGRGSRASTCLLLYKEPLSPQSKARLEVMRQSEDGFLIAEKDLELRGGGEILGTRQSGLPAFRLADLSFHNQLLPVARDDAKRIVDADPKLETRRGQALRVLLYLFERDAVIKTLHSG